MPAFPTTCPFCSCGCGFYLLTNHGQLTGVAPSETHPVSSGKLCARGWSAHEAALWGERLTEPQLRKDAQPESSSWDEALDHVAARIRELTAAGKLVGVLGSARATNEENYLAGKLARAGLQTNNVDFSYHSVVGPLLDGLAEVCGDHIPGTTLSEIASSHAILLVEGNLAETHPRAASSVMKAVESGARLVTTGYRTTQMARLSSLHLPSAPGYEDVINGLLAAVLDLKLQDAKLEPTRRKECETLWRDFQDAKRTDELRQAAEWIARAERATFLLPCVLGQHDQTQKATAALATLAAITGHLSNAGSGLLPLFARSNVRGACDMGIMPDRAPGYVRLDDEQARQRLREIWGKTLPTEPGGTAEDLLQSVSGLIVLADDPPSVLPSGQGACAAIEKIEFLVALDAFATPTARKAHAVLPIASFAETDGTIRNMEGRVQRLCAAANPPGKARMGWQVLGELCARFGVGGSYDSAKDVLHEIELAAPPYAGIEGRLSEDGWNGALLKEAVNGKFATHRIEPAGSAVRAIAELTHLLVRDGSFDWGRDPLVSFSPTLNRDSLSEQRFFPDGFVEVSKSDADTLDLCTGRRVRLTSSHGNKVVPIRVRADLRPGVFSVPYAFRDQLGDLLGMDSVTAVRAERP